MAFRNPLTSLPASGIVGQIQGSQLAADSINGKTITGATIQTAASGQRISLLPPGGAYTDDRLQMDSGGGEAKPSFLKAFPPASDTSIQTVLSSADLTAAGVNQGAVLVLKSGNNTNAAATVATLQAGEVDLQALHPDGTKGPMSLTAATVTTTAPITLDPDWSSAILGNSWVPFGGGWRNPQFRLMADGMVQVRGMIKLGTTGTAIFTLPAGYRPTVEESFACQSGTGVARVDVAATGIVSVQSYDTGGSNTWVNLATVRFYPD